LESITDKWQKVIKFKMDKLYLFIFMGVISTLLLSGQKKWEKLPVKADPVVCSASAESGHAFVRPPEDFLKRLKSGKKASNFNAQYVNVPDSARPAIEYALDIWEYLISSDVPIYIRVIWDVQSKTSLGNCGATNYYLNFEGAPLKDTYYPVAAVEKITGKEISGPGNPDMIARFNLTIPWYVGTDGLTPVNKYDLVTIVLHEITHGLGFNGFFRANTSQKTAGYGYGDEFPTAFDRFVENFGGEFLTDPAVFKNNSNDLYRAIISNHLYSAGPVILNRNGNERARLYAPTNYSSGSSIYHLNDLTYGYGNLNSLMTSAAGMGEAIHSPGPIASGMMADFGWKHLYIDFQPLKDREDPVDTVYFSASLKSDLGIMDHSFSLIISRDAFKSQRDTIRFTPSGTDGIFKAGIKSGVPSAEYSYYLSARDSLGRVFTKPYNYPDSVFSFSIGPDSEKPVISHEPMKYVLIPAGTFEIASSVTDNMGVDSVFVVFYRDGREFSRKRLDSKEDDLYSAEIAVISFQDFSTDSIRYFLEATDVSKSGNLSRKPEKGYFSFSLESIKSPVSVYSTDFESLQTDFVLPDFTISRETGFDNIALHSPHPYPSPDRDDASFELNTVLKVPIIIQPAGRISFDEVVLVEPGEEGAVFGNSDFYDYVIVEGSKNGGKTWLPIVDGYDSGSQETWLNIYYRQIEGSNSLSAGTKSMFINRRIELTGNGNFKAGDTLLIRFRLHSDPYAHGWGWTIDNLNIQNNIVSASSSGLPSGAFLIWPNPVTDRLCLKNNLGETMHNVRFEMMDLTGSLLYRSEVSLFTPGEVIFFDTTGFPAGVFFLKIHSETGMNFSFRVLKP
jgi:hypothetical protein